MDSPAFLTAKITEDEIHLYTIICGAYGTMVVLSLVMLVFLALFLPYELKSMSVPVTGKNMATPFNILIVLTILGNTGLFTCQAWKWKTHSMHTFQMLNLVSGAFSMITFISAVLYNWLRVYPIVEIVYPRLTPFLRILGTVLYPLLVVTIEVLEIVAVLSPSLFNKLIFIDMILGLINGIVLVLFDLFTLGVYVAYMHAARREKSDLDRSRLNIICLYGTLVCCLLLTGMCLFTVATSFGLGLRFHVMFLGVHSCSFLGTVVLCAMKVALHRDKVAEKEKRVLRSIEAKEKTGGADGSTIMPISRGVSGCGANV
ncbi:hypothetical protein BJ741DRAFT_627693 [Chytriomyces cf. hyalinus JEL632]|nr:hypothetical protein BJ741DRAFT_627693 [Chytriomyces cf. hyalinus JEL632]